MEKREIRGQRTDDRGQTTVFRISDGEMRGKESGDRSQEAKSIKHLVKDFVFTLCSMLYAPCLIKDNGQKAKAF